MSDSGVLIMKAGDTRPTLEITCTDDGNIVDFTNATSLRLVGMRGSTVVVNETYDGDQTGKVIHSWTTLETAVSGELRFVVKAEWNDGALKRTFPGEGYVPVIIEPNLG